LGELQIIAFFSTAEKKMMIRITKYFMSSPRKFMEEEDIGDGDQQMKNETDEGFGRGTM
jgi:hypothetical protein